MFSEKKECQNQAVLFNSFNLIITNTLTGDLMVLFLTDILMFNTRNITFLLSLIPLLALVRLPFLFLSRRIDKVKMIKISVGVKMIFVLGLLSIPWKLLEVRSYTLLIIAYQIAVEFGVGICWQPLMKEITSDHDRGQFFAKMRFVFMSFHTGFILLLAVFIREAMSVIQYRSLLFVSLFGLLVQRYAIGRLGKKQVRIAKIEPETARLGNNRKSLISYIRENKKLLWVLSLDLMFLLIGFTLNVVYLKTVLGYSSRLISIYLTVNNIGGTLALPVFGKLFDKNFQKGSSLVMKCYLLYLVIFLMLPVYREGNGIGAVLVILFALLSGVIASSVYLMMTILQHRHVKTEDTFLVFNMYQMIVFAAAFLVTNLFGIVISNCVSGEILTVSSVSLDRYKVIYSVLVLCMIMTWNIRVKREIEK